MKPALISFFFLLLLPATVIAQNQNPQALNFNFDGDLKSQKHSFIGEGHAFVKGIEGESLQLRPGNGFSNLALADVSLNGDKDFTVQFWVKTTSENTMVLLSQKEFNNKSLSAQKNAGWALYTSGGSFAFAIGSGSRRINYERDNGDIMPVNDGLWHLLTMTYSQALSEVRLYYDGHNKAIYKVDFSFDNNSHLLIGSQENNFNYERNTLPEIKQGARQLQTLVDEFNKLKVESLNEAEFLSLIVDPKALYIRKLNLNEIEIEKVRKQKLEILDDVLQAQDTLLTNPYTIFQNKELTKLKPIGKLYALSEGKVTVSKHYAKQFTSQTRLYPSDFAMDNLSIFEKTLNADEVLDSYKKHRKTEGFQLKNRLDTLTVAVWNIWHGGKHFTNASNDWDSRMRIVEMLRELNADVILMQETYSSGDFIAAELGYYFATTSDWDYRCQGSNISVLSRYPITALDVPDDAGFMNISAKLTLSKTQEIYAMSNWYGMSSFPKVFDFHKNRFDQSNTTPILFGGDFNAVPHTDGGDSPASIKMLENGFKDAYRSLYPDIKTFPGFTHQWRKRIDQLYYKGSGLKNESTEVISTWFGGFPSDHFMILSKFKLEY